MAKKKTKRKASDKKMSEALDRHFKEELNEEMKFGDEIIEKRDVGESVLEYMKIFGANKNLYRVIPNLISGMKPGKTRLYYAWWEMENRPQNTKKETLNKLKFYKVEILSSRAELYHPHGTASMQEIIGKDGQYWSNNAMLIDPKGSYGNMRGDAPGAGRYINAKLSEFAIDCFFDDFDNYSVPMKLNYNEDRYEPLYLPAKYPFILFNPQFSGIGYGLASNIVSFNVTEVLDATIKLIKNSDSKIELIPDSPTGCDIVDEGNFKEINKSGISKVTMRASTEIDYSNNIIKISSLPYNSSSENVIKSILELRQNGEFRDNGIEMITDIKDYTQEGKVYIEIYLKNNAKPDKVLNKMMKRNTGLKSTFPVGLTVIDDFEIYKFGVKDLLLAWIDYRLDAVLSMLLNKLQKLVAKQHLTKVLIMIFSKNNIDDAVQIAKTSKSRSETVEKFMKRFKITSVQAGVVADMKVHQFNHDSYIKFCEEEEELEKEIKEVKSIVSNNDNVKKFVINQLEEGKKKWAHPRKSKIVKEDSDIDIPDTEHLIGVTESGWIKKLNLKNYNSIGSIGKGGSGITVLQVNNREDLLIVDSMGDVVKIPMSSIPDMEFEDIGVEMKKFFSVNGSIKAVMELPNMDILKQKSESFNILFITKKGIAKRVQISEFKKIIDKKSGIDLKDGDEVAVAMFSFNETAKDIIISTNMGDGIRLPLEDIKLFGPTAKGLSMLSLKDGEEVVNASIINPSKKLLLYVTSSGRVKVTELKYFPTMNRKGEVLSLISLQGGESLLGVSSVNKSDTLVVYHKNGDPEQINISDIEPTTRIAKGTKIFKTNRGDSIVAYKVFKK